MAGMVSISKGKDPEYYTQASKGPSTTASALASTVWNRRASGSATAALTWDCPWECL